MAEEGDWEAESFEPEEPKKEAAVLDKWDGEDEQEDVKDNWDDEEERKGGCEEKKTVKSVKKKLSEKIKEKEMLQKQEELLEKLSESQDSSELTPEEESEENPPKDSGPKPENEALGVPVPVSNSLGRIDAISPSSKDDFSEFEKLLKDKLLPLEGSTHYSGFLESLFRDLCLSVEVEDLRKINTSITLLLSEKQKQEKQQTKGKKKKKGVVPAGGMKAKMKDDLADYGGFEGGYTQDYEDFM